MFALLVVRAAALFGMFGKGTALNALKARRSVVKYSDKAVPASATTRALEAAIQAPNHFLSEPWRFYTAGRMQCPARHRRDVCSTALRYASAVRF